MGGFRNGKNVENHPQVNTTAVSICTYACTGYKLGSFEDYTHMLHIKHFGRKVRRKKPRLEDSVIRNLSHFTEKLLLKYNFS